jgi:hypothetical protein
MEERLPTLIELIERSRNNKLPADQMVFYYQTKDYKENFIHRDELKKEAALAGIYGHYEDRAFYIKTKGNDKTI